MGMGVSCVPMTDTVAMLDELGYRGELRARTLRLLEAMESVYVESVNAETKRRKEAEREKRGDHGSS